MLDKIKRNLSSKENFLLSLMAHGFYDSMSDEEYLLLKYRLIMGKELNLTNPQTFNEKLQWLKLHDHRPEYTMMVDKYAVKKYVAKRIGKQYIIPTLGVWDKFDDIDFDQLPDQFVLKCTHDSGGLVICRDKANFNIRDARKKINRCLKRNYYWSGREWPYKNVKPRIIAEKYMESFGDQDLIDYKWFCFNGKPEFLYVSHGLSNHKTATIDFYDIEYKKMPFGRFDYSQSKKFLPKPKCFYEMIKIAEDLSKNISFVRIDLYEIDGKVYFSEITFSPCSGFLPFNPPEWDLKLGKMLKLPQKRK